MARKINNKPNTVIINENYYSATAIQSMYGIPRAIILECFPKPTKTGRARYQKDPINLWSESQIQKGLTHPKVAEIVLRKKARDQKKEQERKKLLEYLMSFDIEKLRLKALSLSRRFVLHVGLTNSGKTYQAVQALKKAENGVYLSPLRLLALEIYDKLNANGVPCDLMTGEETIRETSARHTSSTIELANYTKKYKVAVIDEAQMITDVFRGDKWVKALYCLNAEEIHVCLAPEAQKLICSILESFNAPYVVVSHKRMAPLVFAGTLRSIEDTQPGDALIVFSRKSVLAVSAELEKQGVHSSVIYGALPPVSRREEVRRFASGETSVVVATDAIGMGISLPIRRIIFCETSKFDGEKLRPLRSGEIKQIAGRAGRYGIYPEGYVLSMANEKIVRASLLSEEKQQEKLTVPFPEEVLESDYPLDKLISEWNQLPRTEDFLRVDMTIPLQLYKYLKPLSKGMDRHLLYSLITCPVDTRNESLVYYWYACCKSIIAKEPLPEPNAGIKTLESCEVRYKELDIRHQLMRKIGIEESRMEEKNELCKTINRFLKEKKKDYLRRCRRCGKLLPSSHPYGICDECYYNSWEFY